VLGYGIEACIIAYLSLYFIIESPKVEVWMVDEEMEDGRSI